MKNWALLYAKKNKPTKPNEIYFAKRKVDEINKHTPFIGTIPLVLTNLTVSCLP